MRISDWSSDVCSSDLRALAARRDPEQALAAAAAALLPEPAPQIQAAAAIQAHSDLTQERPTPRSPIRRAASAWYDGAWPWYLAKLSGPKTFSTRVCGSHPPRDHRNQSPTATMPKRTKQI